MKQGMGKKIEQYKSIICMIDASILPLGMKKVKQILKIMEIKEINLVKK